MKRFSVIVQLAVGVAIGTYAQEKALTIDECVAIALEQNPDIVMGEFTAKIAGKNVTVAMSNFLPRATFYLQYDHNERGPSSITYIDPGTGIPVPAQPALTTWASSAYFSVNQQIFDGGYSIANYLQSRSMKKSANFLFKDSKQTTILLVRERYYNLIKAEKLLEVATETLRGSEESFKRADVLFEVGRAPKSDVLQARVQLETDRLGVIQAENSLSIARASLNHILGFDVDDEIKVVDTLDVPEINVTYEDALINALADHPVLHQRQADVRAARAGIGMAASEFIPSFSVFYSYSWSHTDFNQIRNIFETDFRWRLGVQMAFPVFRGLSRFANTGIARLNYKSSLEALEQGERDVALEAKQAYFEVGQAQKSIAVSRNAMEAAEEGLRLNREKYDLGAGTMLDLIVAQVSNAQAQSDHIQSLYDYKYAVARLQKAMGKLER